MCLYSIYTSATAFCISGDIQVLIKGKGDALHFFLRLIQYCCMSTKHIASIYVMSFSLVDCIMGTERLKL